MDPIDKIMTYTDPSDVDDPEVDQFLEDKQEYICEMTSRMVSMYNFLIDYMTKKKKKNINRRKLLPETIIRKKVEKHTNIIDKQLKEKEAHIQELTSLLSDVNEMKDQYVSIQKELIALQPEKENEVKKLFSRIQDKEKQVKQLQITKPKDGEVLSAYDEATSKRNEPMKKQEDKPKDMEERLNRLLQRMDTVSKKDALLQDKLREKINSVHDYVRENVGEIDTERGRELKSHLENVIAEFDILVEKKQKEIQEEKSKLEAQLQKVPVWNGIPGVQATELQSHMDDFQALVSKEKELRELVAQKEKEETTRTDQINQINKERDELKKKMDDLQVQIEQTQEKWKEAQQKFEDKVKEEEEVKAQLKEATDKVNELQTKINETDQHIDTHTDKSSELEQSLQQVHAKVDELQKSLDTEKQTSEQLKNTISILESTKKELEDTIHVIKTELDVATTTHGDAQQQKQMIDELMAQVNAKLTAANTELTRVKTREMALQQQVQEQTSEISSLKDQLAQVNSMLQQKQQERDAINQQLLQASAGLRDAQDKQVQFAQKLADMENQLATSHANEAQLRDQISNSGREDTALRQTIQQLQLQLQQSKQLEVQLHQAMDGLKSNGTQKESQLSQMISALQAEIAQRRANEDKLMSDMQATRAQERQTMLGLQEQLRSHQLNEEKIKNELLRSQEDVNVKQSLITQLQSEIQQKVSAQAQLADRANQFELAKQTQERTIQKLQADIAAFQSKESLIQNQLAALQQTVLQSDNELVKSKHLSQELQSQVNTLLNKEQALQQVQGKMDELRSELVEKKKLLDEAKRELKDVQLKNSQLSTYESQNASLNASHAKELEEKQKIINKYISEVNKLDKEISSLTPIKAEKEHLEKELKQVREARGQTEADLQKTVNELKEKELKYVADIGNLNAEVKRYKENADLFKGELEALQKKGAVPDEVMKQLTEQKDKLNKQIEDLKTQHADAIQKEKDQQKGLLEEVFNQEKKKLEDEKQDLADQLTKKTKEFDDKEKELQEYISKNTSEKEEIGKLEQEMEGKLNALAALVDSHKQSMDALKTSHESTLQEVNAEKDKVQKMLDDKQKELEQKSTALDGSNVQIEELGKLKSELEKLTTKITGLVSELDQLKIEKKTVEDEKAKLVEEHTALLENNGSLIKKYASLEQTLTEKKQQYDDKIKSLEDQMEKKTEEINEAKGKKGDTERQLKELRDENKSLLETKTSLNETIDKIREAKKTCIAALNQMFASHQIEVIPEDISEEKVFASIMEKGNTLNERWKKQKEALSNEMEQMIKAVGEWDYDKVVKKEFIEMFSIIYETVQSEPDENKVNSLDKKLLNVLSKLSDMKISHTSLEIENKLLKATSDTSSSAQQEQQKQMTKIVEKIGSLFTLLGLEDNNETDPVEALISFASSLSTHMTEWKKAKTELEEANKKIKELEDQLKQKEIYITERDEMIKQNKLEISKIDSLVSVLTKIKQDFDVNKEIDKQIDDVKSKIHQMQTNQSIHESMMKSLYTTFEKIKSFAPNIKEDSSKDQLSEIDTFIFNRLSEMKEVEKLLKQYGNGDDMTKLFSSKLDVKPVFEALQKQMDELQKKNFNMKTIIDLVKAQDTVANLENYSTTYEQLKEKYFVTTQKSQLMNAYKSVVHISVLPEFISKIDIENYTMEKSLNAEKKKMITFRVSAELLYIVYKFFIRNPKMLRSLYKLEKSEQPLSKVTIEPEIKDQLEHLFYTDNENLISTESTLFRALGSTEEKNMYKSRIVNNRMRIDLLLYYIINSFEKNKTDKIDRSDIPTYNALNNLANNLLSHWDSLVVFITEAKGDKHDLKLKEEHNKENEIITFVKIRHDQDVENKRFKIDKDLLQYTNNTVLSIDYDDAPEAFYDNTMKDNGKKPDYKYKMFFGPFTKVFDARTNNGLVTNLNIVNDESFRSNVMDRLARKEPICIIGYGASGSGKTSTLIKLKKKTNGKEEVEPGVLMHLMNAESFTKVYQKCILNIYELYANEKEKNPRENPKIDALYDGSSNDKIAQFTFKDDSDPMKKSWVKNKYDDHTQKFSPSDPAETLSDVIDDFIEKKRKTFATTNNDKSSRSHVIIEIKLFDTDNNDNTLFICDFAGVENEFNCASDTVIKAFNEIKFKDSDVLAYEEETSKKLGKTLEKYMGKDVEYEGQKMKLTVLLTEIKSDLEELNKYTNDDVFKTFLLSIDQIVSIFKSPEDIVKKLNTYISNIDNKLTLCTLKDKTLSAADTITPITYFSLVKCVTKFFKDNFDKKEVFSGFVTNSCTSMSSLSEKNNPKLFALAKKFKDTSILNNYLPDVINNSIVGLAPFDTNTNKILAPKNIENEINYATNYLFSNKAAKVGDGNMFLPFKFAFNLYRMDPSILIFGMLNDVFNLKGDKKLTPKSTSLDLSKVFMTEVCNDRLSEGLFINDSLEKLRFFIGDTIKAKNKGAVLPKFYEACLPIHCHPYYEQCFGVSSVKPKNESDVDVMYNNSLAKVIKTSCGDKFDKLVFCIFNVINLSKDANNPPPIPYIDISKLLIEDQRLQHIPLESKENYKVNETFIVELKKLTSNEKLNLSTEFKSELSSLMEELKSNPQKRNLLKSLISKLNKSNAQTTIGTMEFIDTMAKFGTLETVCTYPATEFQEIKIK